jgi:hypothetical protein
VFAHELEKQGKADRDKGHSDEDLKDEKEGAEGSGDPITDEEEAKRDAEPEGGAGEAGGELSSGVRRGRGDGLRFCRHALAAGPGGDALKTKIEGVGPGSKRRWMRLGHIDIVCL